ncbi:oxidoreductase [Nocardia sp. NBC_01499]|uniref:oxidoreductase n=1 Tax=Nocardia sp. NBC_01499 TaxID=2903597 RepID=UPI0038694C54
MAKYWTAQDVPPCTGMVALITGASSGLGLYMAGALAARGARVLLACRDVSRGRRAVAAARSSAADGGTAELAVLDLADLASVRRAAAEIGERCPDGLDILINNAGVMGTPCRRTVDGFELQMATNHLGPAALTWLLCPVLRVARAPRVVTVSSLEHRRAELRLNGGGLGGEAYRPLRAYADSKLAALLFAFELDRRARRAGMAMISVAAHPGVAYTHLMANTLGSRNRLLAPFGLIPVPGLTQPVRMGAAPILFAATMPAVHGGEFYGPNGWQEIRGYPDLVKAADRAYEMTAAERVWDMTAAMTKVMPDPQ